MSSFVRISVIAGATLLAGCSTSWMPSWNLGSIGSTFSRNTDVSLTIESDPPGADARTSVGPGCRTPCMIPVPGDREFTVTYTLNGFLPMTVSVRPSEAPRSDFGSPSTVELTPNPVYAQLERAPPPAPIKRQHPRPKKKAAPKAPATAPGAPAAAPPPNPAVK